MDAAAGLPAYQSVEDILVEDVWVAPLRVSGVDVNAFSRTDLAAVKVTD